MLVTLIVPLLLVLVALLVRGLGKSQSFITCAAILSAPVVALVLLAVQVLSQNGHPVAVWEDDSVARAGILVAAIIALVTGLLESSRPLLATTFWNAGMLSLASVCSLPAVQWAALLFSVLPLVFYGRTESTGLPAMLRRNATLLIGCALFTFGDLLMVYSDALSPTETTGVVLLICGLGGMLGWFPFPQVIGKQLEDEKTGAIFGKRFLPLLTAAVLVFRLVERQPLANYPAILLVLAALLSLLLSSVRLLQEERLSRRLTLEMLSAFSLLLLTIVLQNWQFGHAERDWQSSSNVWGGRELFISILICETAGLLLLASGFRILNSQEEGHDFSQTLAGVAGRRPVAAGAAVLGLFTLAGLPPWPGFWCRFGLITALILPHRLSNVTRVMEADHQFAWLAIVLIVLLAINGLGHLRLFQQMVFDEPFRVRGEAVCRSTLTGVLISTVFLLGIAIVPLSAGKLLSSVEKPGIVNSTEETETPILPQ